MKAIQFLLPGDEEIFNIFINKVIFDEKKYLNDDEEEDDVNIENYLEESKSNSIINILVLLNSQIFCIY